MGEAAYPAVEGGREEAHVDGIVSSVSKVRTHRKPPPPGTPGWYRGVKLQRPLGTPKFPEETLKAAVVEAFAAHARKLAGSK